MFATKVVEAAKLYWAAHGVLEPDHCARQCGAKCCRAAPPRRRDVGLANEETLGRETELVTVVVWRATLCSAPNFSRRKNLTWALSKHANRTSRRLHEPIHAPNSQHLSSYLPPSPLLAPPACHRPSLVEMKQSPKLGTHGATTGKPVRFELPRCKHKREQTGHPFYVTRLATSQPLELQLGDHRSS